MKNAFKRITLVAGILVALIVTTNAQDFAGIATYQSSRKSSGFEFKGEGMTPEMEAQMKKKMLKQFQRTYELRFNLQASIWNEEESLDGGPATVSGGGMMITMSAGGGKTYKNTVENRFMQETEVFSKPFLLDDELETMEWEMTQETKKIGNYTAYKAIHQETRTRSTMSFGTDSEDEMKEVTDTVKIEAWYTPEIPVSQGPANYWGLPGLILEVSDGSMKYICTKVVLNPDEKIKIKPLSKGKKVNREELREITEEKTKEMMQKYSNGGGNVEIKIGRG